MTVHSFPLRGSLTPEQCVAGRLLARWSVADLAGRSGVHPLAIEAFEAGKDEARSGGLLLMAFDRHDLTLEFFGDSWRWLLDGAPFNHSTDMRPHVGGHFLGTDGLEWPRSPDLPEELFVRPVPVPWWATSTRVIDYPDGFDAPPLVTERPASGPIFPAGGDVVSVAGALSEVEREWIRRNPWALDRWPELREAPRRSAS
jgi:hypothetical protein